MSGYSRYSAASRRSAGCETDCDEKMTYTKTITRECKDEVPKKEYVCKEKEQECPTREKVVVYKEPEHYVERCDTGGGWCGSWCSFFIWFLVITVIVWLILYLGNFGFVQCKDEAGNCTGVANPGRSFIYALIIGLIISIILYVLCCCCGGGSGGCGTGGGYGYRRW